MEKVEKHILYQLLNGDKTNITREQLTHFSLEFHRQYNLIKRMETQGLPISKSDLEVYAIYENQEIDIDYAEQSKIDTKISLDDYIKLEINLKNRNKSMEQLTNLLTDYQHGDVKAGTNLYKELSNLLGNNNANQVLPLNSYYLEQKNIFTNIVEKKPREGLVLWEEGKGLNQFKGLAELINVIGEDEFVVVGARPAVGKTSWALALMNALYKNGYKAMFVSLEMSNGSLLQRLATAKSGLDYNKITKVDYDMSEEEINDYLNGLDEAANMDILLIDRPPTNWLEMKQLMIKHVDEVDYFIIDHLHIIGSYDGTMNANENQMLGQISREMKMFAREYKKPVILLAQLNREGSRGNKRVDQTYVEPFITDLRGSGAIEQDADKVMMLYREITGTEAATKRVIEEHKKHGVFPIILKIEKNRSGETGNVKYLFRAKQGRWSERAVKGVENSGAYKTGEPK